MERGKAERPMPADIDRTKHDEDYAERVIGGARVSRTGRKPSERITANDRAEKPRAKTDG